MPTGLTDALDLLDELNARDDLDAARKGNINSAFKNLRPQDFLTVAPILAGNALDGWSAYEVCKAVENGVPTAYVEEIAKADLDFRQTRGLRHLAEAIGECGLYEDVDAALLFSHAAARNDHEEQWYRTLGDVLKATDFNRSATWLKLSLDQLRSVRFAVTECDVPDDMVARYATGDVPPASMDIISIAVHSSEATPQQLPYLLKVSGDPAQVVEAWSATAACNHGSLSEEQLAVVCNPELPQPTMNALRIALTYYGLSLDAARTVTAETTPDEVWRLTYDEGHEYSPATMTSPVEEAVEDLEPDKAGHADGHDAVAVGDLASEREAARRLASDEGRGDADQRGGDRE